MELTWAGSACSGTLCWEETRIRSPVRYPPYRLTEARETTGATRDAEQELHAPRRTAHRTRKVAALAHSREPQRSCTPVSSNRQSPDAALGTSSLRHEVGMASKERYPKTIPCPCKLRLKRKEGGSVATEPSETRFDIHKGMQDLNNRTNTREFEPRPLWTRRLTGGEVFDLSPIVAYTPIVLSLRS